MEKRGSVGQAVGFGELAVVSDAEAGTADARRVQRMPKSRSLPPPRRMVESEVAKPR